MTQTELQAGHIAWIARNFAYNLDFVPDDKLGWKPAPEASSALEITDHSIGTIRNIMALLKGEKPGEPTPATTREEAKAGIIAAADDLAAYLKGLPPESVDRIVTTNVMGDLPAGQLMTMGVMDTMHHHGQIAYIQTLLGDTETHFQSMEM